MLQLPTIFEELIISLVHIQLVLTQSNIFNQIIYR